MVSESQEHPMVSERQEHPHALDPQCSVSVWTPSRGLVLNVRLKHFALQRVYLELIGKCFIHIPICIFIYIHTHIYIHTAYPGSHENSPVNRYQEFKKFRKHHKPMCSVCPALIYLSCVNVCTHTHSCMHTHHELTHREHTHTLAHTVTET